MCVQQAKIVALAEIEEAKFKNIKIIHMFVDELMLAGVREARIINHLQFAYEIFKINDNDVRAYRAEKMLIG